jgi:hypothetical protein
MDSKSSNIIQIGSTDAALMATKYVELYPKDAGCWKHFGLEKIYPPNHTFNIPSGREDYVGYFKVIDKEKFLWAMMLCGVEFEFVKDFDAICNETSPQNSFGWH